MGLNRTPLFAAEGAAGAVFEQWDGWLLPERFGNVEAECAAVRSGAGLYDLSHLGVMSLDGPDARRFCNGMFTNNIRALRPGSGNISAMVDDKAKIQGLLDLLCTEDTRFLALLDGVTPEDFSARYARFIIFDDVELEDQSEALGRLSVQGPGAAAVLARAGLPVPAAVGQHSAVGEGDEAVRVYARPRSRPGGYEIVAPRALLPTLWEALIRSGATPVGTAAQEVLRIEAGLARWPVDMGERALPHEMRLVERACAFDKGCYIGQEVINRIDVMGQVAKKLWGLELAENAIPPLGAEVKLDDTAVGVVASGAREGSRARCLAVLRKAAWKPGLVVTVTAGERTVSATVYDLPFSVPEPG